MENKSSNINFVLQKITTEQFAILEQNYSDNETIELNANIRFGADNKQRLIAVFTSFIFNIENQPFLKIEAGCHFQIAEEAWNQMMNDVTNTLTVPKGFMAHLAMLTVGTTRGILHAKTEGTSFNRYFIPTINVAEMIKADTAFQFESQLSDKKPN